MKTHSIVSLSENYFLTTRRVSRQRNKNDHSNDHFENKNYSNCSQVDHKVLTQEVLIKSHVAHRKVYSQFVFLLPFMFMSHCKAVNVKAEHFTATKKQQKLFKIQSTQSIR